MADPAPAPATDIPGMADELTAKIPAIQALKAENVSVKAENDALKAAAGKFRAALDSLTAALA